MHGDKALEELSRTRALPTAMRLYLASVARANVWGHAAFEPAEMGRILSVAKGTRLRAIDTLKSAKIVAPQSTSLCMVLSATYIRRGDLSKATCMEPKHWALTNRMWIADFDPEWEPEAGYWNTLVNDANGPAWIAATMTKVRSRTRTTTVTETETVEEKNEIVISAPRPSAVPHREVVSRRCYRPGCDEWESSDGLCFDHFIEDQMAAVEADREHYRELAAVGGATTRTGWQ